MIEFLNESGHLIGIRVSEKVTHADYQILVPKLEELIKEHGKIYVLFQFHKLTGFEMHAMWDDLKFDWKHDNDLGACAIVGEKSWQSWMISMSKPFVRAEIKYFDVHELDTAWAWLRAKAAGPVVT